ncbi:allene oxide cyclase barrel-like domain-containing protein [Streptomyces formicae]
MENGKRRPLLVKCAALSLVAAGVGVLAVGSAAADTSGKDRAEVIELQIKDLEYQAIDVGPTGPGPGDMSVFCGTAVENGRTVGRGAGTSQIVSVDGERHTSQAVITIELERGSLTMQSLQASDARSLDMAITGGTGAFKDARGTARYWDIATPRERMRAEILH